jgi:hypothetical protein
VSWLCTQEYKLFVYNMFVGKSVIQNLAPLRSAIGIGMLKKWNNGMAPFGQINPTAETVETAGFALVICMGF